MTQPNKEPCDHCQQIAHQTKCLNSSLLALFMQNLAIVFILGATYHHIVTKTEEHINQGVQNAAMELYAKVDAFRNRVNQHVYEPSTLHIPTNPPDMPTIKTESSIDGYLIRDGKLIPSKLPRNFITPQP